MVEKPVAVANSGQWPSGVQRVHSGLVLLVVVVVSCSVARCGVAPAAQHHWRRRSEIHHQIQFYIGFIRETDLLFGQYANQT